jgi:Tfp pilus assembly protein PilZ
MRPEQHLNSTAEMRALLVSQDDSMVSTFIDVLKNFGVDAQKNVQRDGLPAELRTSKFEALVVDFDTLPASLPILPALRESPSNRHALIFAVATGNLQRKYALEQGANFVFQRPLVTKEIRQVIRLSYNLMVRERRRYFRCTVNIPAFIRSSSGSEIRGVIFNISSTGVAIKTSSSFNMGDEILIGFSLEGSEARVSAIGKVVWDDKHGKSGLSVRYSTPEMQRQVDNWLDSRFSDLMGRPRSAEQ